MVGGGNSTDSMTRERWSAWNGDWLEGYGKVDRGSCLQQPVQGQAIKFLAIIIFINEHISKGEVGIRDFGPMSIFMCSPSSQGSAWSGQGDGLAGSPSSLQPPGPEITAFACSPRQPRPR